MPVMKVLLFSLLLCCISLRAADAPTLTDMQKLTLQNKYLQYENAKLKLDTAQVDLLAFVQSLQKEGYTFDINSMTYSPVEKK